MDFDLSRMRVGTVREFKGPDGTITVTRQDSEADSWNPSFNGYLIVFDTEDVLLEFVLQDYYNETKINVLDSSKSKNGYSNRPKKMTEKELKAFDKFLNRWVPPRNREIMNGWVLDRWNVLIKGSPENPLTVVEKSNTPPFSYFPSIEKYDGRSGYSWYEITGYAYKGHGSREYPVRLRNYYINGEPAQIGTLVIKRENSPRKASDLTFSFETITGDFSCSGILDPKPKEEGIDMFGNFYQEKAYARIESINDIPVRARREGKTDMGAILNAIVFAENAGGPYAKKRRWEEPVVESKEEPVIELDKEPVVELEPVVEPKTRGSNLPVIGGVLAGISALGYWFTRRS